MRCCAVVGDPAGHSLSPAIHRAGYAAHGLDWSYDVVTVPAAGLQQFVSERLADPTWVGLSVTAPHKEAILKWGLADKPSRLVGGGNTLVFDADRQSAKVYNTDVTGFVRAWRAHNLDRPRTAAVVGNGATARSIVLALAGLKARQLVVLARAPERAAPLIELATALGLSAQARPLGEDPGRLDLVASTIPAAALAPHAEALAASAGVVFDVVYDPWPTALSLAAERAGRATLNGLDLLAGQAVDQFFLFTGRPVTFEQCRSAAGRELRRRQRL